MSQLTAKARRAPSTLEKRQENPLGDTIGFLGFLNILAVKNYFALGGPT
jgi:hypothetical protein